MFGYRILAGFKGAGFLVIKMIFPVEPFQAGMQKPHPSQKNVKSAAPSMQITQNELFSVGRRCSQSKE
jgi:hypothetical protein